MGRAWVGGFVLAVVCGVVGCIQPQKPMAPEAALQAATQEIARIVEDEGGPRSESLEPPATPDDPRHVTFWYYTHPLIAPAFGPGAEPTFQRAHPGVRLSTQFIGDWGVAVQKLTVTLAAGDMPDVAMVDRSWLARLIPSGRITPLETFLPPSLVDDFRGPSRAAFTVDGRLYAVPADGFCSVLFYNESLVATPPRTWEELRDAAAKLAPRLSGRQVAVGHYPYLPALWSAGGQVLGNENTATGLSQPAALETLSFITGLKNDRLAHPYLLNDEGSAFQAFLAGDVAMTVASSAFLPQTQGRSFKAGVAPIPGKQGPVSRLSDHAVVVFRRYADAKHEAISRLLGYLTGQDVQGSGALAKGSVPVRASVAGRMEVLPGLGAAYDCAGYTPLVPAWGRVESVLDRYLGLAYAWQPGK